MKIRNGFVSNSSSSSFIVHLEPVTETSIFKGMYSVDELLTPDDLKKVLAYGFQPTAYCSPSALEHNGAWNSREEAVCSVTDATHHLGFSVSCNEDEVIEFLVENDIPFTGSTHYGHESVFYRRGSKTLLWIANPGLAHEMYGHGGEERAAFFLEHYNGNPVRREPVEQYKKEVLR